MLKKFRCNMILVILMVIMLLPAGALAEFKARVITPNMKIYFAASTKSESIGSIPEGKKVTVKRFKGDWALIDYKGNIGYARVQDMLSLSPSKAVVSVTSKITYTTYRNPKPRTMKLKKGTSIYVCGKKGNKYLIMNVDGDAIGYISKKSVIFIK